MDLVSCIVPVYNGERYLGAALESILEQDHRPFEIIVVDDGSTDTSAALAESYGPPVRVERQAQLGPAAARNTGVQQARGAFLGFLEADDLYRPGKISRQLDRFAARPELEISLCIAENFWEAGLEEEEQRYRAHGKLRTHHNFTTMLARRRAFDRVGPVDSTLVHGGEVLDWFLRLTDMEVVVEVLDEVLVSRRMHRASRTHSMTNLNPFVDVVKRRLDAQRASRINGTAVTVPAMEIDKLVTCVVPVYNGERYLGAALESILEQDHRPLEIIVVDDGSTDTSAALAASYGPLVDVERQANLGLPSARNTGIRKARGSFVCFLDADDLFRPGKLSRQLERFSARPELEVSLCLAENFWEGDLEEEKRYRTSGKVRASHFFQTMLARKSVFERVGLLDPLLVQGGEAADWFLRLTDAGVVTEALDEVLVSRRMHAASQSHNWSNLDPFVDLLKRRLDERRR